MPPRKRWLRQPLSWRRGGAVALALVVVLAVAALVLDAAGDAGVEPVVAQIQERGRAPVEVIVEVGRGADVLLVSDVHGLEAPKRIVAEAIGALADGPGLDAVVLPVSSDEQPHIDAYLNAREEDAAFLLNRPAAVREDAGTARAFLEIYRAVWQANAELGAARQIRVIAADVPAWPPPRGASSTDAADLYASRTEHMLVRMDQEILSRIPDARLLVFVDGYLALKRTHGEVRFAGGDAVRVGWLGETLRERAGGVVRTVLLDAGAGMAATRSLPTYHGTRLHRSLRRELETDAGIRTGGLFDGFRDPVLETSSPALRLEIRPEGYTLGEVADAYVFLQAGR